MQKEYGFVSFDLEEYVPERIARIPPTAASLHYSHAVFEGMSLMRVDGRMSLFHPQLNLERMRSNAEAVGLDMRRFSDEGIISGIFTLAALDGYHRKRNGLMTIRKASKSVSRIYVRPLLYAESEGLGLGARMRPRLLMKLSPMGRYLETDRNGGIDAMLYPLPRELPMPSVKISSNYQIGIVSRQRMERFNRRYNERCVETVFTSRSGALVEGSGENLAIIKDGKVITPHPSEGAIPGITMRLLSTIALRLGLGFEFGTFRPEEVESADALFMSGNAAGVVPVSCLTMVDKDFALVRKVFLDSAKCQALRALKREYERMEVGAGRYAPFHVRMDDWMDHDRAESIHIQGRRMIAKLERAMRRMEGLASLRVEPPEDREPRRIGAPLGLSQSAFYPAPRGEAGSSG